MSYAPSEVGSPRNPYFMANFTESLNGNVKAPMSTDMYKSQKPGTPPTAVLVEPADSPSNKSRNKKAPQPGEPFKVPRLYSRKNATENRTPSPKTPQVTRGSTPVSRSHSPFPMENHENPLTPVGDNLVTGEKVLNGARTPQLGRM